MSEKSLTRLLLFSGLFALLVMSLLFDIGAEALQMRNAEGAGLEPLLVVLFPLFEVIVILGGLALFWYLLAAPGQDRLVGQVFAVIGLLLTFAAPLLFFLPVPMSAYALAQYFAPGSFLFQAAALLGVGGALSLALKKGEGGRPVEPISPEALSGE